MGDIKTNGVDLSATYRLRSAAMGTFNFGMNTTYINQFEFQNEKGGEFHDRVNIFAGTGPIFKWQSNATVNWTGGKFGAGLAAHYKSGYLDEDETNRVASYTTFDGYATWEAVKRLTLTAGIRNLFDRDPPLSFQTTTFQAGFDPRFTDPTGRAYYVRATYNF